MGGSTYVFFALYLVLIIFGCTGNWMVVQVVRTTPSMHSVTNFLLTNLAIADALTLGLSPFVWNTIFRAIKHPSGKLGDVVCMFLTGNCFIEVTINVSMLTLCILAIERFNALVKPMIVGKRLTKNSVKFAICGMWLFSILFCIPSYTVFRYKDNGDGNCFKVWEYKWSKDNKGYVLSTITLFFTAFLLLSYCYTKIIRGMYFTNTILATENDATGKLGKDAGSRKKLMIMFLTATINFAVSYCFLLGLSFYGLLAKENSLEKQEKLLSTVQDVSWLLVFTSCSVNPLLYHLQSENYRRGFVKILRCGCGANVNRLRRRPTSAEMYSL